MTAVERLLAIAHGERGYLEKATNAQLDGKTTNAGHSNYTKYARDLAAAGYYQANKQGYDWCDMFVDWCMLQLCGSKALAERVQCQSGPYGAGCTFSARYYDEQGRLHYSDPQPGDQIFFGDYSHTGIVEKVEDGRIYTIEGNAGDRVAYLWYHLDDARITAFGRPRWELVPDQESVFVDVAPDAWYADAVAWAVDHGVAAGVDGTHFAPNQTCTRAQAMTMIWAMMGKPEPEGQYHPFADVQPTDWYAKAVQWAVQQGITSGISGTRFGPDLDCTRGQIVTYLWRLAGSPEQGSNQFADIGPGDYFYQACLWAAAAGITAGTGNGQFSPEDPCTRAQIVTMLHAYSKL